MGTRQGFFWRPAAGRPKFVLFDKYLTDEICDSSCSSFSIVVSLSPLFEHVLSFEPIQAEHDFAAEPPSSRTHHIPIRDPKLARASYSAAQTCMPEILRAGRTFFCMRSRAGAPHATSKGYQKEKRSTRAHHKTRERDHERDCAPRLAAPYADDHSERGTRVLYSSKAFSSPRKGVSFPLTTS